MEHLKTLVVIGLFAKGNDANQSAFQENKI